MLICINIKDMVLDWQKGFYSIGDEIGRNVTSFGVDMSPSSVNGNKKRYFNSW